ncbi:MAG TPA: EAL domain-containing protein [Thermoanaerobaculia bacterium]|jgi:EAL domain-containing protein (putative c-di-GMP-specific phosphodiesterase class I)
MSESALNRILQPGGITPVYQPMYRVGAAAVELWGFECLSRGPRGTNFESADVLFDYVRLKREESLVDRACIVAALRGASPLPPVRLALNVHASTLGRDHGFIPFLQSTAAATGIAVDRLTIEIVEHAPPWDGMSFRASVQQLRELGAQIALDDIGLGQSNFKMLLDVRPHYLKVDRYFADGCANDGDRRAVIGALRQLACEFSAELVAEGVSTQADSAALQALGVTLMQGFLFARPLSADDARSLLAATA